MKVIIQRVSEARVTVDGSVVGQIGKGLLLLVGFGQSDTSDCVVPMAEKIAKMRIFHNDAGRFDKDVTEVGGEILAVPQFTLYADTSKGRRPEFFQALEPSAARKLFEAFVEALKTTGCRGVATGEFGAHMHVHLVNDGPVTITLER